MNKITIYLGTFIFTLLGILSMLMYVRDIRALDLIQGIDFGKYTSDTIHGENTAPNLSATILQKFGVNPSKEFPWMPDPCAKPRRQTGVEDLLCMPPPSFLPDYKNPCYKDDSKLRCLPYFHLIGFGKCGTSDLFKRMYLHPEIIPNKGIFGKEVYFWTIKRFEGKTLSQFTESFYPEKIEKSVDESGWHYKITGHGDPMDVTYRKLDIKIPQNDPHAQELLWTTPYSEFHVNPRVKLLISLRDPVDRLYSLFFFHSMGKTSQDFHQKVVESLKLWKQCLSNHTLRHCIYDIRLEAILPAPIKTSMYNYMIKEWLQVFPRDQLFVFRSEDYANDIKGILTQIFRFLTVSPPSDKLLSEMEALPNFYETKLKAQVGPMKPETRRLLVDFYKPYTEDLGTLLGDEKFAYKDTSHG